MRKRFTNQFKAETAMELLRGDKTIGQIASERGVVPTQLSQWPMAGDCAERVAELVR